MELPGCKVHPTDEQLVSLLFRWLSRQSIPPEDCSVKYVDLYGEAEVPDIWKDNGGLRSEHVQALYFLTSLKKVKNKRAVDGQRFFLENEGVRFYRGVGKGRWHPENGGVRIEADNNVVGRKKLFSLRHPNAEHDRKWIMHEFSIDSEQLMQQQPVHLVLCRLKRSRKASHRMPELNEANLAPIHLTIPAQTDFTFQTPNLMSNAGESYNMVDVQDAITSTHAEADNNYVHADNSQPLSTAIWSNPRDGNGRDCYWEDMQMLTDAGDSENALDAHHNMRQPPITTTQAEADIHLVDEYAMPLSIVVSSSPCDVYGDGRSWDDMMKDIPLPDTADMIDIPSFGVSDFWKFKVPERKL